MPLLLKLENAALFIAFTLLYFHLDLNGWLFLFLFFAPDFAFVGYLKGPKLGAWMYNFTHHWGVAVALFLIWLIPQLLYPGNGNYLIFAQLALIMMAHIAFDRMLGYGLKHETSFHDTHLGRIGRG